MAKNNNLQDFLADIADAIREAEGSVGTIAAQDFADKIKALGGIESDLGTRLDIDAFTLDSGESKVPPPYDAEGYNYDGTAPTKQESVQKSLGDLTQYNQLALVWDNQGSGNGYGEIYAKITIAGTDYTIFSGSSYYAGNIVTKIDITNVAGSQTATFKVYARSDSHYRGYTSQAVLNIKSIYVATINNN